MANILAKYGIKEVADVWFYKINDDETPGAPVLYLDTLKVSTTEETAETSDATGGKGNAALISWDYNKAINVTLEDALFSAKSMAIMYGDRNFSAAASATIIKSISFNNGVKPTTWKDAQGNSYAIASGTVYDATGSVVEGTAYTSGETYYVTFSLTTNADTTTITVSADTFPDTYYVTGDTYARSHATGKDENFMFIIPKAKVTSENTLTMDAAGEPSVFSINLKVLRPSNGEMMKLIKYGVTAT